MYSILNGNTSRTYFVSSLKINSLSMCPSVLRVHRIPYYDVVLIITLAVIHLT